MNIVDLRTEYRVNPLGIATHTPRFSWRFSGDRRGARQTAYRILVASKPELLTIGIADKWDSGVIRSNEKYRDRVLREKYRKC